MCAFFEKNNNDYSPIKTKKRMEKQFKSLRLPVLALLGSGLLLMGCTNDDYDFDKVDYTLGFGSGQLTLPSNNSVIVELDDILDLGNSDLISTNENGDYMLGKQPEEVSPISVKIDPLVQTIDESGEQRFGIDLPTEVQALAGQSINVKTVLGHTLDAGGSVSLISYKFEVDPVVKQLKYIGLGRNNAGANLKVDLTLPTVVTKFAKVVIQLPRNFVMTYSGNVGEFNGTDNANTLTLTDFNPTADGRNGRLSMTFNVQGIDIKTYDEANYATYNPTAAEMILVSNIGVSLQIEELQVPSGNSIEVKGQPTFDDIIVTSARGVFDPDINLDNVGTVSISDIPDFLTDKDVVADIANPQIWLTLKTNMPLGGEIDARITSDTYPQGITIEGIELKAKTDDTTADAETKLVICRQAPTENPGGFTPVIVPNLSKLIEKLRNGMTLAFTATRAKAKQVETTVELGKEYHLAPSYEFSAALALGDNASIVYSDKEGDMNGDLDDIQLSQGAKAVLTANVENGIPADLEINITPIDKQGNQLTTLVVTPIKNKVAAGADNGEIEYEITDTDGKALKQLDGVDYRLQITAPTDATQKGRTLNKSQRVVVKDITLELNGKIVYDAN